MGCTIWQDNLGKEAFRPTAMSPHATNGIGFPVYEGILSESSLAQSPNSGGMDGPLLDFALLILYIKEEKNVRINPAGPGQDGIVNKKRPIEIVLCRNGMVCMRGIRHAGHKNSGQTDARGQFVKC